MFIGSHLIGLRFAPSDDHAGFVLTSLGGRSGGDLFNLLSQGKGDPYLIFEGRASFTGPDPTGMGSPNPFLVPMDVTFTSPQGRTYVVLAFYDGNGAGGMDGNV
jgi:hypothetical protein